MAFKKTLWYDKVEELLRREVKLLAVMETQFDGAPESGAVKVYTYADAISIVDYTGADMTPEDVVPAEKTLLIDRAKAFYIRVDDMVGIQGDPAAMENYVMAAVSTMNETIEADVLTTVTAKVDAGNVVDYSTVKPTVDTIVGYIEEVNVKLNNVNAKKQRFIMLDTQSASLLRQAGLLATATITPSASYGPVDVQTFGPNMIVIESTLVVADTGVITILAGTVNDFIQFVGQTSKLESKRAENNFKDIVQGLYVYGVDTFNGKKGSTLLIKDYAV